MFTDSLHTAGQSRAGIEFTQAKESPFRGAGQKQFANSGLTMVAHDLRGPLASIRALVELIEAYGERQAYGKIGSCVERAQNIIDGLEGLLNSVLERVRSSGDPLGFDPKRVDLNDIVETAVTMNLPMAESKSVTLCSIQTVPLVIQGDDRLLLQAIVNLVGNAVKHSKAGMTVTCSTVTRGEKIEISVEDTGAGLTDADLARAFQPFTKLSSKSSDKAKSWGLGLWFVKLIVAQHDGRIEASSNGPGRGSVFTITLPTRV